MEIIVRIPCAGARFQMPIALRTDAKIQLFPLPLVLADLSTRRFFRININIYFWIELVARFL